VIDYYFSISNCFIFLFIDEKTSTRREFVDMSVFFVKNNVSIFLPQ